MATRKAGGSTQLGRDSNPKYLGIKLSHGQKAKAGAIVVKQRGTKFRPGINTKRSGDDSIFATKEGVVEFTKKRVKKFNGKIAKVNVINVISK